MKLTVKKTYWIILLITVTGFLICFKSIFSIKDPLLFFNVYWPKISNDFYCYETECYYTRYALFNLLIVLFLIFFKKRTIKALSKIKQLNNFKISSYKRATIVLSIGLIFIVYFFRMNTGFIFSGINGWIFYESPEKLKLSNAKIVQLRLPDSLAFLEKAINKDNIKFIKDNYEYLGQAMFIHFDEKNIMPVNLELLEFVFPHNLTPLIADSTFIKCVSNSLKYRRKGRKNLLKQYIAYPNHTVWSKINYVKYPTKKINKISFWKLGVVKYKNQIKFTKHILLYEIY